MTGSSPGPPGLYFGPYRKLEMEEIDTVINAKFSLDQSVNQSRFLEVA